MKILTVVGAPQPPQREYDGRVYVERIQVCEFTAKTAKVLAMLRGFLDHTGSIRQYPQRERRRLDSLPADMASEKAQERPTLARRLLLALWAWLPGNPVRVGLRTIDYRLGAVCRFLFGWSSYHLIIDALCRRARTLSLAPRVGVCYDVIELAGGIKIKQRCGCSVVCDAHELWPET